MSRLAATIGTDVRLQFRNGFYYATVLAVAFSIALLRWLPVGMATLILPVVILQNVLMNAFYFVSGLVLLERVEGTFTAQSTTPLRPEEYLASKVISLTALSLVESLAIAAAVFALEAPLLVMAAGITLAAVLFCLAGVALVVRYHSVNEFLMPSVVYTLLLTVPMLGVFGIGSAAWYVAHPIQGPLTLMRVDGAHTAGGLAYAIGYPLLWIVPASVWSRRALMRLRSA